MADFCCDQDDTFWSDQLAAVKAMIPAYNAAILALATGAVQSYQLDTGQTRQMVTKLNLTSLRETRNALLNEVATLEARLGGCGTIHVVPNF